MFHIKLYCFLNNFWKFIMIWCAHHRREREKERERERVSEWRREGERGKESVWEREGERERKRERAKTKVQAKYSPGKKKKRKEAITLWLLAALWTWAATHKIMPGKKWILKKKGYLCMLRTLEQNDFSLDNREV